MPAVVPAEDDEPHESVESPGKVMRIGSMIKQLLEEVRQSDLDEPSRERLREIYETSITELASALSPDLQDELARLALPFDATGTPSGGRAAHRQGAARGVAGGPVPRHPGHAVRPADGRPPAARADAGPAAPARALRGAASRRQPGDPDDQPARHLPVGPGSQRARSRRSAPPAVARSGGAGDLVAAARIEAELELSAAVPSGIDLADVDRDRGVAEPQLHRAAPAELGVVGDDEGDVGVVLPRLPITRSSVRPPHTSSVDDLPGGVRSITVEEEMIGGPSSGTSTLNGVALRRGR